MFENDLFFVWAFALKLKVILIYKQNNVINIIEAMSGLIMSKTSSKVLNLIINLND